MFSVLYHPGESLLDLLELPGLDRGVDAPDRVGEGGAEPNEERVGRDTEEEKFLVRRVRELRCLSGRREISEAVRPLRTRDRVFISRYEKGLHHLCGFVRYHSR